MNEKQNRRSDAARGAVRGTSLSAVKRQYQRKRRQNRFFAVCAVLIFLAIAVWAVFDKLFVIEKFSVRSSQREYTEQEAKAMAKAVGLETGMHVFGFDRKQTAQNARYALSEFDEVKINYDLPNGIVFDVTEATPAMYYVSDSGNTFILSEGLRVLSMTSDTSTAEMLALKRVYIGGVTECIAGNFLGTDSGSDEILKQLYAVLKEEMVLGETGEINVTNKFSLSFLYKQRFTVLLGDADNLSVKVRFMKSIADERAETDSGIIDVSDEDNREGVFKYY